MTPPIVLKSGRIAEILLNRPEKLNAMTAEMGGALRDAVQRLGHERETRAVVLRGAGKAFSAGGDFALIEANSKRGAELNRADMVEFYSLFLSLVQLPVPVVAAIQGAAVGAGLCVALAADIRLAATNAKLGANFVRVGLHPGMGSTALLPHVVGPARAAELLYTGKLVDGAEAERIGLVSRAVAPEQLDAAVSECAEAIASAAPIAVRQTKATLRRALLRELHGALETEALNQAIDFGTGDLQEAIASFRENRRPDFTGG
ncbi:MAG: enoyl-CoA hydratase-related protein [Polyangiaceae bacterium]